MESPVVIAATESQILAICVKNRRQLLIKKDSKNDSGPILDLHASDSGIYHAAERIRYKKMPLQRETKGRRQVMMFATNFVQVYESISGNSVNTISLDSPDWVFDEKEMKLLDFTFLDSGDSLGYMLDGKEGKIFPHFRGGLPPYCKGASFHGGEVYFLGKSIGKLNGKVIHASAIDMYSLESLFKQNVMAYKRNTGFFQR